MITVPFKLNFYLLVMYVIYIVKYKVYHTITLRSKTKLTGGMFSNNTGKERL